MLFNHPTFYAEDGAVWYADAYSFGWLRSLASPAGGYLNTLPRLVAALLLWAPFSVAPLMMNLTGLVLQALPVNVILLKRSNVWGPLPFRLLQAAVYLVLPNVEEVQVVLTNAQFHVALISFLFVVGQPPRSRIGRILYVLALALNGFTGPFCFAMLPIVAIVWFRRRDNWSKFALIIYGAAAAMQALELSIAAQSGRPTMFLGATAMRFIRIVSGQIYVGAILGRNVGPHLSRWPLLVIFVLGTALLLNCLRRCRIELRLFVAFSSILFGAALLRPFIELPNIPAWLTLSRDGGNRYWFFPLVAFAWCIVWSAFQQQQRLVRIAAICLLVFMIMGVIRDWRLPKYNPRQFPESAQRMQNAAEGELVVVPMFPAENWRVRLEKKGPVCRYPPMSGLDSDTAHVRVDRLLPLHGWVAAAEPIKRIDVVVDGKVVNSEHLTLNRPEIDRLWPFSANRQKGWAGQINVAALAPGEHRLSVYALQEHGCRAQVESFVFTKTATP